jgi:hypothetical protein
MNVNGFFGIPFGTSMAEARKIVVAKNIGQIEESLSDKNFLIIVEAKLDFEIKKYNPYWGINDNQINLAFTNDKFHTASVSLPKFLEGKDFFATFTALTEDLNKRYYETSDFTHPVLSYRKNEDGVAKWKFKQADGTNNVVGLVASIENVRLLLVYGSEKVR